MEVPFNSQDAVDIPPTVNRRHLPPALDAFRLVAIPEPSVISLMLTASLGLAMFQKRSKAMI